MTGDAEAYRRCVPLMLLRPYRDGSPAITAWHIAGLKTAAHVRGTRNRPEDLDQGWSVEIAVPYTTDDLYVITAPSAAGGLITLRQDRKVWQTDMK